MIEIRSYRRVFELERRIYRIDRLRLNPGGVPVRGIVYFLVLAAVGVLVGGVPLLRPLARIVPWYLRGLLLPGVGAALLTLVRLEGRAFHMAARALLSYRAGPRHLAGLERRSSVGVRWRPGELLVLPDGSDPRVRRLRYVGPGAVLVTVEHERFVRGSRGAWSLAGWGARARSLVVRELPGGRVLPQGEVVALARGTRLLTRRATEPERSARGPRHEQELAGAPSPEAARG